MRVVRARLDAEVAAGRCETTLTVPGSPPVSGRARVPATTRIAFDEYRRSAGNAKDLAAAADAVSAAVAPEVVDALFGVLDGLGHGDLLVVDVHASEPAEAWPWELLARGSRKLSADPRVVVRRVVEPLPHAVVPTAGAGGPVTTVLMSGPEGEAGRAASRPLTASPQGWVVESGMVGAALVTVPGPVSLGVLDGALPAAGAEPVDVLVLVAHGEERGVLLAGDDQAPTRWVPGDELAAVVRGRVRLVVLLACKGTGAADGGVSVASALARHGVPTVAFHPEVLTSTAAAVSTELTRALKVRHPLHDAVRTARVAAARADLTQGGVFGMVSLWQPGATDVHLRPPYEADTGVAVASPNPTYDHFVGRTTVLAELQTFVGDPHRRFLGVIGAPGAGKSRLMRHLLDATEPAGAPVIAALLRDPDPGTDVAPLDAGVLTDRVGAALAEHLGGTQGLTAWQHLLADHDRGEDDLARWGALVEGHGALRDPVLVVIDALDELEHGSDAFTAFLATALPLLPEGVKVVLTARGPGFLPRPNSRPVDTVDLADHQDTAAIAEYARWILDRRLPPGTLDAADRERLAQAIAARAEGVFLYARAVLEARSDEELATLAGPGELDAAINRLPDGLAALYDQIPDRTDARNWSRCRDLLAVVCARLDTTGFSTAELADILGWRRLDVEDLLAAEPAVAAVLRRSGDRLRPFHASLADWVLDLHDGAVRLDAHERIGLALARHFGPTDTDSSDLARYHLRHTPRHLLVAMAGSRDAKQAFTELYQPEYLFEAVLDRGPVAIAHELEDAEGLGAEPPPAWVAVLADLAKDGPAWWSTRAPLLQRLQCLGSTRDDPDLSYWAEERIRNGRDAALLLSFAKTRPDPVAGRRSLTLVHDIDLVEWNAEGTRVAVASAGGNWFYVFEVDRRGRLDNAAQRYSKEPIRSMLWEDGRLLVALDHGDGVEVVPLVVHDEGVEPQPSVLRIPAVFDVRSEEAWQRAVGNGTWRTRMWPVVALGPGGALAVGSPSDGLRIEVRRPSSQPGSITSGHWPEVVPTRLSWNRSGDLLAIADESGTIRVVRIDSGSKTIEMAEVDVLDGQTTLLCWSHEDRLAVGTTHGALAFFDGAARFRWVRLGEPVILFPETPAGAWHPGTSPNMFAVGESEALRLIDVDRPGHPARVGALVIPGLWKWSPCFSWSPDGALVAVGLGDSLVIQQLEAEPSETVPSRAAPDFLKLLAWHPSSGQVATRTDTGHVTVLSIDGTSSTDDSRAALFSRQRHVAGLVWSPDGQSVVAVSPASATVCLYTDDDQSSCVTTSTKKWESVHTVAWAGRYVVTASDVGIRLYLVREGRLVPVGRWKKKGIASIRWRPQDTQLLVGRKKRVVLLRADADLGLQEIDQFVCKDAVTAVGWDGSGRVAFVTTDHGLVTLAVGNDAFGSSEEYPSDIWFDHDFREADLDWHPSGGILAGADDGVLRVLALDQRRNEFVDVAAHPYHGMETGLAWSPDGTRLGLSGETGLEVMELFVPPGWEPPKHPLDDLSYEEFMDFFD